MRILQATLTAMLFLAGSAPGLAADVAGGWTFLIANPQEAEMRMAVQLQQADGRLSGTIVTPAGVVPLEGTIKGSDVALWFTLPEFEPGLAILLTLSGKLQGESMRGAADYGSFGGGEWTARRLTRAALAAPR